MSEKITFTACACHFCEYNKPENEVLWDLNGFYKDDTKEPRECGWLTNEEVEKYVQKGRVEKSMSSTNCPPCATKFLGLSTREEYEERITTIDSKQIRESVLQSNMQFRRFEKKYDPRGKLLFFEANEKK